MTNSPVFPVKHLQNIKTKKKNGSFYDFAPKAANHSNSLKSTNFKVEQKKMDNFGMWLFLSFKKPIDQLPISEEKTWPMGHWATIIQRRHCGQLQRIGRCEEGGTLSTQGNSAGESDWNRRCSEPRYSTSGWCSVAGSRAADGTSPIKTGATPTQNLQLSTAIPPRQNGKNKT